MQPRWTRALFGPEDLSAIAESVRLAESRTSAEIRVHLERHRPSSTQDALARARDVFAALEMHRTALRNGVLIYLAVQDHELAIVGDDGIHARVGDGYWEAIRDRMVDGLRSGRSREAVVGAVSDVGEMLARWFPRRPDDVNELSDDVSQEGMR